MKAKSAKYYAAFAKNIRMNVLEMVIRGKSGHIGSSFSIADILAVLYGSVLAINPKKPTDPNRDRFILSKGHAAASIYAALALKGFFPEKLLLGYYQNGGKLPGHVTHKWAAGVEASSGALGHGLPLGCGMAYAGKADKKNYRVFVALSDGECDEGTIWEAALFAAHHKLDNLVVIVDYNKIQSLTWVKDTIGLEPFRDKWEAFGWTVREVDGHNHLEMEKVLSRIPAKKGKPTCIIAHTTKGAGVSFMEDNNLWHYRTPDEKEAENARKELTA